MATCLPHRWPLLWLLTLPVIGLAQTSPRYLGAYIQGDTTCRGDIAAFERTVGAPLSFYTTYRAYGMPFPTAWARDVIARQRGLIIFWEPWTAPGGLDSVADGDALRRWAGTLSRCPVPVLLVFGSEPNMDHGGRPVPYEDFRSRFRLVAGVMRRMAPRVELVFSLARPGVCQNPRCSELYYPGDPWVDWVAFTSYDNGNPGAWTDLDWCLSWAAARWPGKALGISEVGCHRLHAGTGRRLLTFLQRTVERHPGLRLVNYFSLDAARRAVNPKPLYYQLTPGSEALQALQWAATSGRFVTGPPPLRIAGASPEAADDDPWVLRGEALTAIHGALPTAVTGGLIAGPSAEAQALAWLQSKGIVQGFPGGETRSQEAVLGWELVLVLQRTLARILPQEAAHYPVPPLAYRPGSQQPGPGVQQALAWLRARGALVPSPDADLDLWDCMRRSTLESVARWLAQVTRAAGAEPAPVRRGTRETLKR